jgi:hypothetical protein
VFVIGNVEGAVLERRHEAESYSWLLPVAFLYPSCRRLEPPSSALPSLVPSTTWLAMPALRRTVPMDPCIL